MVANEAADAAVAEVVRIEQDGVMLVGVLPGSVDDNRALLESVPTPANPIRLPRLDEVTLERFDA